MSKAESIIVHKFLNQNRFETMGEFLKFMKIGIEDGWLISSNREMKAVYKMVEERRL